jgi:hypothetical protein
MNILFYYLFLLFLTINFMNRLNIAFLKQFFFSILIFLFYQFYVYFFFKLKIEIFFFNFLNLILIFFVYSALQKSISIKMVVDINKKKFNFKKYYKIFKKSSFDKRVKNLIEDGLIISDNNVFKLSMKGKRIRKIFFFIQNIYGIKNSG